MKLGRVFGDAPVSSLSVFEKILEDVKGMLHASAYPGFELFKLQRKNLKKAFRHRFDFAALGCHIPDNPLALEADLLSFLNPKVKRADCVSGGRVCARSRFVVVVKASTTPILSAGCAYPARR